jgi:beta-N-acetylhexosaminidase
MSVLESADHQAAARAAAAAAVTVLRGPCGGALVRGPVTVTAASGRTGAKANLEKALQAAGIQVVASGGAVVHLVGYGDEAAELSPGAAVTVAMDTPTLLAQADSAVLVATYSSAAPSMSALGDVLAGRARPAGTSPIAVAGLPRTAC